MAKKAKTKPVRLLAFIAWLVVYLLGWTTRIKILNPEVFDAIKDKGEEPLLGFWHGRQFFCYYPTRKFKLVAPASFSSDGEIINKAMGALGHTIIRGSSSRGAAGLIVQMIRGVKNGHPLALSVDGPKGPFRQAKLGIVSVAQKTGCPIVPTICCSTRMWIAHKSWDKFMLPKPFSTVYMKYLDPIYVPRKASKADLEKYRQQFQDALEAGYKEIDTMAGHEGLEDRLREEVKKKDVGRKAEDGGEEGAGKGEE